MADSKMVEALKRLRMRLADGVEFPAALRDANGGDISLGLAMYRAIADVAGHDAHDAMRDRSVGDRVALVDLTILRTDLDAGSSSAAPRAMPPDFSRAYAEVGIGESR